jgi:hypothetical protein
MPTGYTAGILDGEIKDFRQFAILCIRNFGATIHMRDEPLGVPYELRKPCGYHSQEIDKANRVLEQLVKMTDDQILQQRKFELEKRISNYKEWIETAKQNEQKLKAILVDVYKWQPPTPEHENVKKFMIEQIRSTIDFDCDTDYYVKEMLAAQKELESLNPAVVRVDIMIKAATDLQYHTTELEAEVKGCNDSNKWVVEFINSLPNSDKKAQVSDTTTAQ